MTFLHPIKMNNYLPLSRNHFLLAVSCFIGLASLAIVAAAQQENPASNAARLLYDEGNYAEAFVLYKGCLESQDAKPKDLSFAINCLQPLNRTDEVDQLFESTLNKHHDSAEIHFAVGKAYRQLPQHGYEVAGEFHRGNQRGGGAVLQIGELDRIRAIRLFVKAIELCDKEDRKLQASIYEHLSHATSESRQGRWSWRLQTLTDLETLPDPIPGWNRWGRGATTSDPPVEADDKPLLYEIPESWETARSDGERWRWAISQWSLNAKGDYRQSELSYADFLISQFGISNLDRVGWKPNNKNSDAIDPRFDLSSLTDEETIAKLANGISRFTLPEGHRFLEIYRRYDKWEKLANAYLSRTQRSRAAAAFKLAIEDEKDERTIKRLQKRHDQIVEPWVKWEASGTHAAAETQETTIKQLHLTHRNTEELQFTAKSIDIEQLLSDLKQKIQENSKQLSHQDFQIEQLGWRLLEENQQKYIGPEVTSWSLAINPAEDHADRTDAIDNPLVDAGAYLVEVSVKNKESKSRLVVWVTDTVLIQKPTDQGPLYAVLDALTGKPIAGAKLELFGYNTRNQLPQSKKPLDLKQFVEQTDNEGLVQIRLDTEPALRGYNWLAMASTDGGRLAHLGFNNLWFSPRTSKRDLGNKIFLVTDRPVYRPGDKVAFKAWIAKPSYAIEAADSVSPFAHKAFQVELLDARGDKVWSKQLTANANGGIAESYSLPLGTSLGNYRVQVTGFGGGTFRVEEYRKPEFEVSVEAPDKPITLGESFEATIRADYYFGSPVANAKVRYRVMRSTSQSHWHPIGPWDWLYGKGYNWVGTNAEWHPRWSRWGCYAPTPSWMPGFNIAPEMVAEGEADIAPNGTYQLKIDTANALARNPDLDYRYQVIAEVTDASRRTITGQKSLLAAKSPVRATLWLDKGYYEVGDTLSVSLSVRTPDGKPVEGEGTLRLMKLLPGEENEEEELQTWELFSDAEGSAELKVKASQPGRYRLVYTSLAVNGIRASAGSLFTIRGEGLGGEGFRDNDFRFNALELIPDRVEYQPGDTIRLLVNADRPDSLVALFVRPLNGVYGKPQMVRLTGKSTIVEIPISAEDYPNFFVEGITVSDGKLHTVVNQIVVPPATRVIGVEALPSADAYLPGQEANLKVRLSDGEGSPLIGEATIAIYDKSIDAIAGSDSIGDIRKTFWSWRRSHRPISYHNLSRSEQAINPKGITAMEHLGLWSLPRWEADARKDLDTPQRAGQLKFGRQARGMVATSAQPMMAAAESLSSDSIRDEESAGSGSEEPIVTVRKNFADTALWVGSVETDSNGIAEIPFTLPESLTAWRIRVWGMASGTRVGEGEAEIVTRKDLMVRLQAPRFLVQSDEVTLSAIVNNYYTVPQTVKVRLETEGNALGLPSDTTRTVTIEAGGETRIDWLATAKEEGEIKLRAIAIAQSNDPSSTDPPTGSSIGSTTSPAATDAMQIELPILIHGAERVESFSEVLGPDDSLATFEIIVPEKRRPESTRLEFHYRPSLVGAMLDAIPYLIEYPHGCTEQTLNRFLPAAITQKVLIEMGTNLDALKPNDATPSLGPKNMNKAIYSSEELEQIVKQGVTRLGEMQLSDGGWGWFSGFGEWSSAHTTAVVVRGLLVARENGVAIPEEMISRGVEWLANYRDQQLKLLANCQVDGTPIDPDRKYKRHVDNLDALTYLTLARAMNFDKTMRDRLVDERLKISRYSLGLIGLALHLESKSMQEKTPEYKAILGDRNKVIRNLRQFVVTDEENQTAYLELGGGNWWYWYGSEFETHACFLQLLAATEPKSDLAAGIVKYLLNNRQDAARWDSTRDTALVVEAMADYHRANKEASANNEGSTNEEPLKVEVWLDGKQRDTIEITPAQALLYDGKFLLEGNELSAGRHTLELRKSGNDRLFIGGTLTNFSLESDLRAAGLEVKIARRMTKLTPIEATGEGVDGRGGVVSTTERKYRRTNLPNLGEIQSGELVEVELTISSKNDYEYLLIEDPKPAGFEPVDVRSGYNGNGLRAYVEFRDQQVMFYARRLARGEHTLKYQLRAETPGKFAALPAQVSAMYAPDLRGNSDEQRVIVLDKK